MPALSIHYMKFKANKNAILYCMCIFLSDPTCNMYSIISIYN